MIQKQMLLSSSVKSVKQLDPIGNMHLFICTFDSKGCSSASPDDFAGAVELLRELEIQEDKIKVDPVIRNVGWRFFCLGKEIPAYENGYLKNFTLPFVNSESSRIVELNEGITKFYTSLKHVSFPRGQGYCQFSGGGDLCYVSNEREVTVITSGEEEIGNSPKNDFEEIEVGVIEGEKMEGKSPESVISQLRANMIVACVNTFINNLGITNKNLHEIQMLSSYGIVCTGAGDFGFMKLEIDFSKEEMTFVRKIQFAQRPRILTAVHVDLALDYIVGKLNTEQHLMPDSGNDQQI